MTEVYMLCWQDDEGGLWDIELFWSLADAKNAKSFDLSFWEKRDGLPHPYWRAKGTSWMIIEMPIIEEVDPVDEAHEDWSRKIMGDDDAD